MNMDVAAVFLASSLLIALGFIIWIGAILIVNNLLHRFWKPFNLYRIVDPEGRFEVNNKDNK